MTVRFIIKIDFISVSQQKDRKNGKFVLFIDASRTHWFLYHRLLDIKRMVIVAYFFRGNPLSPQTTLSNKHTFPEIGQHIQPPLLDQLWSNCWNEK